LVLVIAKAIVKGHHGVITVESNKDQYPRIKVFLPVIKELMKEVLFHG